MLLGFPFSAEKLIVLRMVREISELFNAFDSVQSRFYRKLMIRGQ